MVAELKKVRVVSEDGLRALYGLAGSRPSLFLDADPVSLIKEMEGSQQIENAWSGEALTLSTPLDDLNRIENAGPGSDAGHARLLVGALPQLTTADWTNERVWASLNCFALSGYVPVRWGLGNTRATNLSRFVRQHWLGLDRRANAGGRLWWLYELAERAEQWSTHSRAELLECMAGKVNLYHQILSRPLLMANSQILGLIYDAALTQGNDHLFTTPAANRLMRTLNVRAAARALDVMDQDELKAVVSEAVPPKEP